MIEEIKKEISQECQKYSTGNSNYAMGIKEGLDKVLKILDKYNNQTKYILDNDNKKVIPKSLEELKDELGNNYDKFMYEMNLELLIKLEKYKLAWEELTDCSDDIDIDRYGCTNFSEIVSRIKQKYNLGGE